MGQNLKITSSPSFGKFIKVKGHAHDIKHFRKHLLEQDGDFLTLMTKRESKKPNLYIISKKDYDKFIDLTRQIHFFELRTHLEKYMGKKPKVMDVEEVHKQLKNGEFKI